MGISGLSCLLPACSCPDQRQAFVSCCFWSACAAQKVNEDGGWLGAWLGTAASPGQEQAQRGRGWGKFQAIQVMLRYKKLVTANFWKCLGRGTGITRWASVAILENVVVSYLHISGYPLPARSVVQQVFVNNAVHPLLLCDLSHNSHVCQEERYVFQWCYLSMQHWWTKDQVQFTAATLSWAVTLGWVQACMCRKTQMWLVCVKVILHVGWIMKAPSPWVNPVMLREVNIHLLTTYIHLLLLAPALPTEGSILLLPQCYLSAVSSIDISSSFGLWTPLLVFKGCELLAAYLCMYPTWP